MLDRSHRASDIPAKVEEGDKNTLDRLFQDKVMLRAEKDQEGGTEEKENRDR